MLTVTPVGECQGLHLVNVDRNGFTVAENGGGHSQVSFNWIAVGQRLDATQRPVPAEPLDPTFDQQLTDVMTNDNNPSQQGTPLWYDGQRTRFAPGPAAQRPVVKAAR